MTPEISGAEGFGKRFGDIMASCDYRDGQWQAVDVGPLRPLSLHPATHALHYASACFEGIKAFRQPGGGVKVFRLEQHVKRLQSTARGLHLPVPAEETVRMMVAETVKRNAECVPEAPGALYVRPFLFGSDVNIGAVTQPSEGATLLVIVSPVGDYFASSGKPLVLDVMDDRLRAVPGIAGIKAAANYASALDPIVKARKERGADQVLFCPAGDVQETGTSNFLLIDDKRLLTKPLSDSFLGGVTRDSVLRLAADLGYEVIERDYSIATMMDWIVSGEAALCGTAAAVAPVGTLIFQDKRYAVNAGRGHPNAGRLRTALTEIQYGHAPDRHDWLSAELIDAAATPTAAQCR